MLISKFKISSYLVIRKNIAFRLQLIVRGLIFGVAVFAVCLPAYAGEDCLSHLSGNGNSTAAKLGDNSTQINFVKKTTLTENDEIQLTKLINNVNQWITPHFTATDKLNLIIDEDSQAFLGGPRIVYGSKFLENNHTINTIEKLPATWVHEYGHTIFLHNLAKLIPGFEDLYDPMGEYTYSALAEQKINFEALEKMNETDFVIMYKQHFIYSELFADLIAILHLEDPAVIADEITYIDPEGAKWRDFSQDHPLEGWTSPTENEFHGILSPTRTYIGKKLLPTALKKNKKGLLLYIVYEASVMELGKNFRTSEDLKKWQEENAHEELNKNLIEQIEKLLVKYSFFSEQ